MTSMNGMTPFTAAMDLQRQSFERTSELMQKGQVTTDRAETMAEVDVGETPSEVVYTENKLELLHYEPMTEEQHDVPILITYALINRPYILDLQPDRSVVQTLLKEGFDVYMIDWNEPSNLDQHLTLDDYVSRYIDNCVDVVRERSGQDSINVLGYCMGGTMSVMYAALFPEKVRNLALMAAGLCFERTGGVLELWGDQDYYSPETVVETFGNVPAEFLDIGFALMDPVDNFVTKYIRLYDNIENEDFVKNFARMEEWLGDGIDVAGQTYKQFLEDVYQENKLYKNELYLDGKHVDLNELTMPVLQIVGEYDHLIPPEASTPFNEKIPSEDTEVMKMRSGHIGLSVSSSSHRELWPNVCDWFEARSETEEAAEAVEASTDAEPEADIEPEMEAEPEPRKSGAIEAEEPSDVEPIAEDLTDLSGVGQAYADRLNEAGIETVRDLANADPVELAAEIDVSESRVRDWVSQAEGLAE